jgi:hypothetical protein
LVIKALDPDWIRIRIGLQPQTLAPDPDQMNADPKPWLNVQYRNRSHFVISLRPPEIEVPLIVGAKESKLANCLAFISDMKNMSHTLFGSFVYLFPVGSGIIFLWFCSDLFDINSTISVISQLMI